MLCENSRRILCPGLFVLLTCIAVLSAGPSLAQQPNWSFDDHPHPRADEYTEEEQDYYYKITDNPEIGLFCSISIKAYYQVYNTRYPQYSKSTGGDASRLIAWRMHLIDDNRLPGYYDCFFMDPYMRFSDMMDKWSFSEKLLFCGNGDEPVFLPDDRVLKEIFYEVVEYAHSGLEVAVSTLIHLTRNRIFNLNPDLEYYFRKITRPDSDAGIKIRNTDHLDTLISAERRRFLEGAVQARDYQAVFTTIKPCEPAKQ